ncbi:MAG: LD-carboxypeptidase [Burkholderiaceae bacterium]
MPEATNAPGKRKPDVYVISPAGAVLDAGRLDAGMTALGTLGFVSTSDRAVLARHQRFAGTDSARIKAFSRAAKQAAPIVMISRGGYGLTRILDQLDFEALADAQKHWVGFSDFTAFNLAMLAQAGAGTWAGPAVLEFASLAAACEANGEALHEDITAASFCEAMRGEVEGLGFAYDGPRGVDVEGVLWGGNLAMVASMVGSRYFPQVDRGLLFLEDVAEHPYRIERLLSQLLHSGVIDRQAAVLLGDFSSYRLSALDGGFDLPDVVRFLRSRTATPIVTGLPFGHQGPKLTLPHGARLGLSTDRDNAWLVFPHHH